MSLKKFIKEAIHQDSRNNFNSCTELPELIPKELYEFYNKFNPVDVEIILEDSTAIKFYPAHLLISLQNDYMLGNKYFIFATREGDPIFVKDNKIYTCVHGTNTFKEELIANCFEDYINLLLTEMK